jgi:hypothetical protein
MMVSGYSGGPLNLVERGLFGAVAIVLILTPFGTIGRVVSIGVFALLLTWTLRTQLFGIAKPIATRK